MKKILIVLLTLMLSASLLQSAAFEKSAKNKTTEVTISSDKPLTTGSNTLTLDITPKYKDARVSVKAFMPAMPGMPAMESAADAKEIGNGKYETTVNLSMGGTWQLHIFITPNDGKKSRVKTSLNF